MDVVTHVSRAVYLDPWCEPGASGVVPARVTCRVAAIARGADREEAAAEPTRFLGERRIHDF
jgi:hypothetical protein